MKRKLLSLLVLLVTAATGARAGWNGETYTATTNESLGSITVNDDATLTINQGVTVDTRDITIADGKTLTIVGPGELTASGANGADGYDGDDGQDGDIGISGSGSIIIQGNAIVRVNGGKGGDSDDNGGNGGAGITCSVTIYSGTLEVYGGEGGDGYGNGGNGGAGITCSVTIYSGTLEVHGGEGGYSDSGNGGNGGAGITCSVNIYSGTLEVYGGQGGISYSEKGGNGGNAFEGSGTLTYYGGNVTAIGGSCGNTYEDGEEGEDGNAFASTYNVDFKNEPTQILDEYDNVITADKMKIQKVYIEGPAPTYNLTANEGATGEYWATFYSNISNYQASSGTQVFKVNLSGDAITMTEITDGIVKSGQGVVLKNTTGSSITMTPTDSESSDNYSGNSLQGTMESISNPNYGSVYVLNKGSQGVGFYKLSESGTIGANKAYLTYSGSLVREFFLFDEATGISLTPNPSPVGEGSVYDLQGRRVSQPAKGLYIVNGKKYLKK